MFDSISNEACRDDEEFVAGLNCIAHVTSSVATDDFRMDDADVAESYSCQVDLFATYVVGCLKCMLR